MPRAVRMTVCSGCIQDIPHKEMYLVSRFMHKGKPDSRNMYTTMYCAKCVKKDKDNYHEIVEKPAPPKKPKPKTTKKKKDAKKK
jgi:hypothetical protein|tara:strand:- start:175 stop:426 length:252 start_codon:yes stop_codon:yes gene_type:complete